MNDTTIMPLKCLNCKKDIPLPWGIVKEISYTHYSYCEECLRKGLKALRALKAVRKCIENLDEVKAGICDDYCKYPEQIKDDEELMTICENCPLMRLQEAEDADFN